MHRPRSSVARIPPPPDIDPIANPYAPVEFEQRNGIWLAKLGCVVVGMVDPNGDRRMAWWSCFLPDTPRIAHRAQSIDSAKDALACRARDWIEAAGLQP